MLLFVLAHFQNGELSDEFAANVDVCLAKDTQNDNSPSVLLAVSKDNVYDGYVGKGFPTDLKRTFLAVRKKDSEEVSRELFYHIIFQVKLLMGIKCL